jgi:hypothetical protein
MSVHSVYADSCDCVCSERTRRAARADLRLGPDQDTRLHSRIWSVLPTAHDHTSVFFTESMTAHA